MYYSWAHLNMALINACFLGVANWTYTVGQGGRPFYLSVSSSSIWRWGWLDVEPWNWKVKQESLWMSFFLLLFYYNGKLIVFSRGRVDLRRYQDGHMVIILLLSGLMLEFPTHETYGSTWTPLVDHSSSNEFQQATTHRSANVRSSTARHEPCRNQLSGWETARVLRWMNLS